MQHTLIPYADRKRLHREYFVRVFIVSLSILSVAVIVGAAALFPAYLRAWLSKRSVEVSIANMKNAPGDTKLDQANKEMVGDQKLIDVLSAGTNQMEFSDVIRNIIRVRGISTISSFNLTHADAHTVEIAIGGVSPTRDELIALRGRLESLSPGTKVDLPIEQLARNTNLPFTFQFVQKIQ